MKQNESNVDRYIRVILGIALVVLVLTHVLSGTIGWIAIAVGAVALVTGLIGFCPLYALLKIRTNK